MISGGKNISRCIESKEGDLLLQQHGVKTHSLVPKLNYVPWIVYNERWDSMKMRMSFANLQSVLCTSLVASERAKIENLCAGRRR